MVKLLIIADDFTGALDTGVQFAAGGAKARVVVDRNCAFDTVSQGVDVLVQDAETRHLSPAQAYEVIFEIVRRARMAGIPYLYKKTDSALRGNVGSELAAVLDAAGHSRLHFAPAFPRQGRITAGGIHYVNGVPVAQSVFGADPFEPVRFSDVTKIIATQTQTPTHRIALGEASTSDQQGILIYDAGEDRALSAIAEQLAAKDELHLLAGCAGFAATLPTLLGLTGNTPQLPTFDEGFLVACASVNPITQRQLTVAEQAGFHHVRLAPWQKLDRNWPEHADGKQQMEGWVTLCHAQRNIIFDSNDAVPPAPGQPTETDRYAVQRGVSLEELRVAIADSMGALVKRLLDEGIKKNLMLTGGDTLFAFMQQIGQNVLEPICELADGAVLSRLVYHGQCYHLISKSGGFGGDRLLLELAERMGSLDAPHLAGRTMGA